MKIYATICSVKMLQKRCKMYHIKSDKRSQASAAELGKGLLRCLQTKSMTEITISDLFRETSISRSTFYRLFDFPEDILLYLCAEHMKRVEEYYTNHRFSSIEELSIGSIEILITAHTLFETLVNNHRMDLLTEMFQQNYRHISNQLPGIQTLDEVTREYVQAAICSTMTATLTTWIKRGKVESAEQLAAYPNACMQILKKIYK